MCSTRTLEFAFAFLYSNVYTRWTLECKILCFQDFGPRSSAREAEETENGGAFPMVLWGYASLTSDICPFILAQVLTDRSLSTAVGLA